MEEELGKQLFIRGTKGSRKISLTEEGMILRKRAEEILDLALILSHQGNSNLCFRPPSPQKNAEMSIIWKKYQIFSKASEKFMMKLKELSEICYK